MNGILSRSPCSPLSVDVLTALRSDYHRLRLMDSALALCGGNQGPAHAALKARVEAKQQEIGMGNWKFLELCKKCGGTGYLYAAYSLTEQSKCRCYDGYVLPANDHRELPPPTIARKHDRELRRLAPRNYSPFYEA